MAEEVARVTVNGRGLECRHCGHQEFQHKTATLDRMVAAGLLHVEGAWDHPAAIYVCGRCGFAHFFMPVPDVVHQFGERVLHGQPVKPVLEDPCLSCGSKIPPDATFCPQCGWTWKSAEEANA